MNKTFERPGMIIEAVTVGPLQTNCFVVGCTSTRDAVVVDAGFAADQLLAAAAKHDLELQCVLQTHAHIDHVAALPELAETNPLPIAMHPDDKMLYEAAPQQAMMFGYDLGPLPEISHWLKDGEEVQVGELIAVVQHLPGHSPGSVVFLFEEQKVALSGDVVFAGSMGRVDLPGSDANQMRKSLGTVKTWDPEYLVLSGHGPETTIEMELKRNPFLMQDW